MNNFFSQHKLFVFLLGFLSLSNISCADTKKAEPSILTADMAHSDNETPISSVPEREIQNEPKDENTQIIPEEVQPSVKKIDEEFNENKYDLSDDSSWNLSVSGWEKLAERDYEGVYVYTNKCLLMYEDQADQMAKDVNRFPGMGHEDEYALMNDIAACYYVLGEAYMRQQQYDKAIKMFQIAIDKYPYAMCWDPKGWFWKIKEIAAINIAKCEKAKLSEDVAK
ncbi:MAG: tetratricopeptide repeat protein [Candidatus Omnitrophica bacterium]|nr:tetratricopeptide repeat protein [Candidatus Omnitrophota bacterium]